jgi:hypothetical protein
MAVKRPAPGGVPKAQKGFGDALARGIQFRQFVAQEVRRGRFKSQEEGVQRLRRKMWGR